MLTRNKLKGYHITKKYKFSLKKIKFEKYEDAFQAVMEGFYQAWKMKEIQTNLHIQEPHCYTFEGLLSLLNLKN